MLALTRSFGRTVLIIFCVVLTGCSTALSRRDQDFAQATELSQAGLLYLFSLPHSRLYVEVDAVEGCVPKEAALGQLRDFLSAYCNKPDGIEIVRSDVIPVEAARGLSARALARRYSDGPDQTEASPPAFLYVLYFDDTRSGNLGVPRMLRRGRNPYAEVYPYPAIYFNTRFSLGIGVNEILLHETGHLLGMVNRPIHARTGHCRNRGCQMNTHVDYLLQFRWFPGRRQSALCAECVAELKQRATQPPPPNLRYRGAVLVRSEPDYHVVSLPGRMGLVVGGLTEEDCESFAAAIRAEKPGHHGSFLHCLVKDEVLQKPARLRDLIERIKADEFVAVRAMGPSLFLETCSHRYRALGQYANAIDTLRQAILLDPQNARLYNSLARMKATCSDASVRNGEEAVSAASKACELTRWKNGSFIDTLAAACAEAGDFKRAIEFQDQALRTGNPTESEQELMRARISLYKRSEPLRYEP